MEQKADDTGNTALSRETAAALIKKIRDGNLSALMILYDKTSPLLFGLIMKVLGDRTAAEEILLDVYTQIWKQSASYDPGIAPLLWLTSVARNNAMARLYQGKRDAAWPASPSADSASEMTVTPDLQKLARSSLESIPVVQRELLEQAFYGGMCNSEMAAQIGKPVGAVRALLRLGLNRMSESFGMAMEG